MNKLLGLIIISSAYTLGMLWALLWSVVVPTLVVVITLRAIGIHI